MAHYALLNENNIVIDVIVGKDESDTTLNWEEHYSEMSGKKCLRTSYNTHAGIHALEGTPFRKNYAGIGYMYDEELDAFISPKPFASWVLNSETAVWEAPILPPQDDKFYAWHEETLSWVETPGPDSL